MPKTRQQLFLNPIIRTAISKRLNIRTQALQRRTLPSLRSRTPAADPPHSKRILRGIGSLECSFCGKVARNPSKGHVFMKDRLERGRLNPVCLSCLDDGYEVSVDTGKTLKAGEVIVLLKNKLGVKYKKKNLANKHDGEVDSTNAGELRRKKTIETSGTLQDESAEETQNKQGKQSQHMCRFCDSLFIDVLMISHAATHCEHHSFPCCFCDKEFSNDLQLEEHLEEKHLGGDDGPEEISHRQSEREMGDEHQKKDVIDKREDDASRSAGAESSQMDNVDKAMEELFGDADNHKSNTETDKNDVASVRILFDESIENGDEVITNIKEDNEDIVIKSELTNDDLYDYDSLQNMDEVTTNITPEENMMLTELLSQYDITDIDPQIFQVLKANVLCTIRASAAAASVKHESDLIESDVFECTDCRQQFPSYESACGHNCPNFKGPPVKRKRGRPRKDSSQPTAPKKRVIEEETIDSDVDPEWKLDGQMTDDEEEYFIDDEGMTFKGPRIPEYAPRSVPCKCDVCQKEFRSKIRLQFHVKFHKSPYVKGEEITYECPHCPDMTFETETELFDHTHFKHKANRPMICPVKSCKKVFNKNARAYLTKHMKTHSGMRKFHCDVCDKRFMDRQTLLEHSIIHMKVKPFQCHICFRYMSRRSRLRSHLKNHDTELITDAVYSCSRCSMGFPDIDEAEEHAESLTDCIPEDEEVPKIEILHKGIMEQSVINAGNCDAVDADSSVNPEENTGITDKARKMFALLSAKAKLIIKVAVVNKAVKCQYCESVYLNYKSLRRHWKVHDEQKFPFVCKICKAAYSTYARVTSHKTTHGYYRRSSTDIKLEESKFISESLDAMNLSVPEQRNPDLRKGSKGYFPVVKHFLCKDCDKTQLHWTYLQIHKRVRHSVDTTTKCKICNAEFPNSWSVAYHKRKVHNVELRRTNIQDDDQNHRCIDCGKVTNSKSALHYHRRAAHAVLSCPKCLLKFGTKVGLETHMLNKHKDDEGDVVAKEGFPCTLCKNSYMHAAGLYTHMKRVHEKSLNHECHFCKQQYFSRYELESHIRTHTDERPYKCIHCKKGFRNTSLRNSHEKIHLNIRPYKCDKCDSAFRRSNALKNHLLLHTGIKKCVCPKCNKRFWNDTALKFHTKVKHSVDSAREYLLIKVAGVDLTAENLIEQLHLFNIPSSKVTSVLEVGFRNNTELPTAVNLSEILESEAISMVFKESGDASIVSEKGKTIATVLKKPIVPVERHVKMEVTPSFCRVARVVDQEDGDHLEAEEDGTEDDIVFEGSPNEERTSEGEEQRIMIRDRNIHVKSSDSVMIYEEIDEKAEMERNVKAAAVEGMVVTPDGKVIIHGEVFQLENTDGQPLNLENAVISVDENGQLIIEQAESPEDMTDQQTQDDETPEENGLCEP